MTRQQRYYSRNQERIKRYSREYYSRHREDLLEKEKNKRKQYDREYKSRFKEYFLKTNDVFFHKESRGRALLKRATPLWYNKEELRRIYRECIRYNDRTPDIDYYIDHIIPISGYRVCGLNVSWNVRIASKSFMMINRFNQERASLDYHNWLKQRGL